VPTGSIVGSVYLSGRLHYVSTCAILNPKVFTAVSLKMISPAFFCYSNNWNLIPTAQDRPFLDSTTTLKHESDKIHFVKSAHHWTASKRGPREQQFCDYGHGSSGL